MKVLRFTAALYFTTVLPFLSACGVVETRPFAPGYGHHLGESCETPFGAYYLPKRLVRVTVPSKGARPDVATAGNVPDETQPACLDYLQSYTSDDIIRIKRNANGLLESVTSNVKDRTPDIAVKLINIAGSATIAARSFREISPTADKIDIVFDPFEPSQLLASKRALRRFGVCVYVENESFDPIRTSPQRWCAQREVSPYRSQLAAFSRLSVAEVNHSEGILYRPEISHKIVVMRKSDPEGPGDWVLTEVKRFEMPNISPVFSLNIQRTFFAENKTEATFREGVLADVRVEKGSELYGVSGVVLAGAKRIAAIPAEIVQFRIADTTAEAELLKAEVALLNATVTALRPPAAGEAAVSESRGGNFIGNCINADGPGDECQRLATGAGQ